jgi:hypothetical protein
MLTGLPDRRIPDIMTGTLEDGEIKKAFPETILCYQRSIRNAFLQLSMIIIHTFDLIGKPDTDFFMSGAEKKTAVLSVTEP